MNAYNEAAIKAEGLFNEVSGRWLESHHEIKYEADGLLKRTYPIWTDVIAVIPNDTISKMPDSLFEDILRFCQLFSPMGTVMFDDENHVEYGKTIKLISFGDYSVRSLEITEDTRYSEIIGSDDCSISMKDAEPILETLVRRTKSLCLTLKTGFLKLPYDDWRLFQWSVENYQLVTSLIPFLKNLRLNDSGVLEPVPSDGDRLRSLIDLNVLRKVSYNDAETLDSVLDCLRDPRNLEYYGYDSKQRFNSLRRAVAEVLVEPDNAEKMRGLSVLLQYLVNNKNSSVKGDLIDWLHEHVGSAGRLPERITIEDLQAENESPQSYVRVYNAAYADGLFHVKQYVDSHITVEDLHPSWIDWPSSSMTSLLREDGSVDPRDLNSLRQLMHSQNMADVFVSSLNSNIMQIVGESAYYYSDYYSGETMLCCEPAVNVNLYDSLKTTWSRLLDLSSDKKGVLSRFIASLSRVIPYCAWPDLHHVLTSAARDVQSMHRACAFFEHWHEIYLIMAISDHMDTWHRLSPLFSEIEDDLTLDDIMSRYDEALRQPNNVLDSGFYGLYSQTLAGMSPDHWYMRWPKVDELTQNSRKQQAVVESYSEWLRCDGKTDDVPDDLTSYVASDEIQLATSIRDTDWFSQRSKSFVDKMICPPMTAIPSEAFDYIENNAIPKTITMPPFKAKDPSYPYENDARRLPPCFDPRSLRRDETVHILDGDPLLTSNLVRPTAILYKRLSMVLAQPERFIPSDAVLLDIANEYGRAYHVYR